MTELEIEQMAIGAGFAEEVNAYKAGWIGCMKVNFSAQITKAYPQVDHHELCMRFNRLLSILHDILPPAASADAEKLII